MNAETGHAQPLFLAGSNGRLFAVWHSSARAPRRALLHVPAFGEEMHKSRRMVALFAQAARTRGVATLLVDPFGTGDSDGELKQATWEGWKDDIRTAHDWLRNQGITEVVLWGHRLGALLATDLLREFDDVQRMLLWNPVPDGNRYLTQFLRLRAASSLMRGEQETAKHLRKLLRQQGTLTVAGCSLPEDLAAAMERLKLVNLMPPTTVQTQWFDVNANATTQPAAATKVVSEWQAAGCNVEARVVQGEPFWSTQEIAQAPGLIEASVDFVAREDSDNSAKGYFLERAQGAAESTTGNSERALRFDCEGDNLIGILHPGASDSSTAVLVIVGGPQYRAGSHRQFVQLARALGEAGVPTLRFDYRSMGDSEGSARDFEGVQPDIRAAIDTLCSQCPNVSKVVLWGLCDGASAACFYAASDARVSALVLLNPWVRTPAGEAKAYITHYYLNRVLNGEFWRKLLRGDVKLIDAGADFIRKLFRALLARGDRANEIMTPTRQVISSGAKGSTSSLTASAVGDTASGSAATIALPRRMANGLDAFTGRVLYILSGHDLTAQEFRTVSSASRQWRALMRPARCTVVELPDADHTFSDPPHNDAMIGSTVGFTLAVVKSVGSDARHRPINSPLKPWANNRQPHP